MLVFFLIAAALTGPTGKPSAATAPEPAEVLVSRQLAESRDLSVGDVIDLSTRPGSAPSRRFRIAGVYEPIPDPMRLTARRWEVRLHLPDLLDLTADPSDPLSAGSVGALNVRLADPDDAAAFSRDVASRMPGLVAMPTTRGISSFNPFAVLERFHLAIALVTVIGSTAFLLALMIMRTEERRETVGILRLIGFTKRRVLMELFFEGLFIALSGAVFGLLLAVATQGLFNTFLQWRYDTALVFVRITPGIALRSLLVAVPLGVLAGTVAAWSALRRDVMAGLRG